jgi:hypothetical protein
MNRTLTESRQVIFLIDKMKGQFAQDRNKPSRIDTQEDIPEAKEFEKLGSMKDV